MSNPHIPVLYTEHKTKKVKIWLDGYLIPRAKLNSARLISAGKHEIDVVFYSSIDEIKPGREFETDRYLITVEENHPNDEPCPRPTFAIKDPTMKNKAKSTAFVPPRLMPKIESPQSAPLVTLERHNPHQWGYAGMTTAMKRNTDDDDNEDYSSHLSKLSKSSHFIPPKFHPREPIQPAEQPFVSPIEETKPAGLFNDNLIHQFLDNTRPASVSLPSRTISWSNWDETKSDDDDEDCSLPSATSHEIPPRQQPAMISSKQMHNWQSLVRSTVPLGQIDNRKSSSDDILPKFDFDDSSFDTLFENIDE